MELKKKYKPIENVLNTINSKYISLSNAEKKQNNQILEQVTNTIVQNLKTKCPLFGGMFERTFYGGSYYDNLKVANPNEFDLDFVLNIPLVVEPVLNCSDMPGFVQVQITSFNKMLSRAEKDRFLKLSSLLDEGNFLSVNKVLVWMEKILALALNDIPKDEMSRKYVDVNLVSEEKVRVYVRMSKGFPAFTLKLSGKSVDNGDICLDVDLVPCFQFTDDQWPSANGDYRQNPVSQKNKFLIVPKKPKGNDQKSDNIERYWRLSFQEQERELIKGSNLKTLKPALRLLKKLRDRQNHKIASYYIKTLFLWTLEEEDQSFWSQPLGFVFMTMLKRYADSIANQKILYYWNAKNNLIRYLKDQNNIILVNIAQFLKNMIQDIERHLDEPNIDPFLVGKYLLSSTEYEKLRGEVTIGKKLEKQKNNSSVNLDVLGADAVDSSNNVPPMIKLGFSNNDLQKIKGYVDNLQDVQNKKMEEMMAQCSRLKINDDNSLQKVLNYLTKIESKLDTLIKTVEKNEERASDNQKASLSKFDLFYNKIDLLEKKVSVLEEENKQLKSLVNASTNGNHLLYVSKKGNHTSDK